MTVYNWKCRYLLGSRGGETLNKKCINFSYFRHDHKKFEMIIILSENCIRISWYNGISG